MSAVAVVVGVTVGVGVGDAPLPPQTIISLPVQTAVCPYRAVGALVTLVAVQLSVPGLYLRPSFKYSPPVLILVPPQTIISLPVQIAVWYISGLIARCCAGCPTVGVGIISPAGVSVESDAHLSAPDDHFIARRPHCGMKARPVGAPVVLVAVQLSVPGLYFPPVFK